MDWGGFSTLLEEEEAGSSGNDGSGQFHLVQPETEENNPTAASGQSH